MIAIVTGLLTACSVTTPAPQPPASQPPATAPALVPAALSPVMISACPGHNAEVEEATAAPDFVYADWIGCGGIGFARSADGGKTWGPAVTVPGSRDNPDTHASSWDPAIAVASDGTVYVSFIYTTGSSANAYTYPVIDVSVDHGSTFAHSYADRQTPGNWGDRDFIAAAPDGTLYLTWDYAPTAANLRLLCDKSGSCAFSAGNLNAVMQVSRDHGRSWSKIVPVQPGYPAAGGDSAPVLVNPRTHMIDVLYEGHQTDPGTFRLHPGYEYFTSSRDGARWPAKPSPLDPGQGTTALNDWWIDGAISADTAGDLYVTWDTESRHGDVGWLSVSTDQGRTWSSAMRVTPDRSSQPHIVESAGGRPGVAYIAWLTSAPARGYALFIRAYDHGRLGPVRQVSTQYGNRSIWPGDTFGIAALASGGRVTLTWGSALPPAGISQIYAATINMR